MPIGQYPSMGVVSFLCALFLSALFPLFGMEIRDTLSAEEYLQPDLLEVSVEIATTGRSEGEVLNTLSAVDNGIRTLNLPYKGGRYKVLPRKVWDKENRRYRFEGFEGRLTYTFELKDPASQRRIFGLLDNLKGKNYPIEYSVRWVGWVVSYKRLERAKEHLKRELLKRAIQRAEDYGKLLKRRCSVKTLSFRDWFNPYPLRVGNVIVPKREGEVVKISALVVFDCRYTP